MAYKIISLFNLLFGIFVFIRMIRLTQRFEITPHWHGPFFMLMVVVMLTIMNQVFTLFNGVNMGWPLKFSATGVFVFTMLFKYALKRELRCRKTGVWQ